MAVIAPKSQRFVRQTSLGPPADQSSLATVAAEFADQSQVSIGTLHQASGPPQSHLELRTAQPLLQPGTRGGHTRDQRVVQGAWALKTTGLTNGPKGPSPGDSSKASEQRGQRHEHVAPTGSTGLLRVLHPALHETTRPREPGRTRCGWRGPNHA